MKKLPFLAWLLVLPAFTFCQKKIAITIDDVPNVRLYKLHGYHSPLLTRLDSLKIPVAIFINEANIDQTESRAKNITLLTAWIKRKYVTLGNHSFSHPHYSEVGFTAFAGEVTKGEGITRPLAVKEKKELKYFRFPFNDLGINAAQHDSMNIFLNTKGYVNTPFTIEGSDWMFNALYEYYLKDGKMKEADRVARRYIDYTLSLVDYLESVTQKKYGRDIDHIYLCHDNLLNADYLHVLIQALGLRDYKFVTLKEVLADDVYASEDFYKGKFGFSWIYRWVGDAEERKTLMRGEPDISAVEGEYEKIMAADKGGK